MTQHDGVNLLRSLPKMHDFFVGVDSDGCAFDTMEIKQQECFTPAVIEHWGLQPVARYAREVCLFVNLYSRYRGQNRYVSLVRDMDLLRRRQEVKRRGFVVPDVEPLRRWTREESRLGEPALAARAAETGEPVLARTLAWSRAVNAAVARICRNVPPFAFVREALAALRGRADVIVVSATPEEAIRREWAEHGLDGQVAMICGQEIGTKREHLRHATAGRYAPARCLMIGDAPGDLAAARDSGVLFYPIVPGREEDSWRRFVEEASRRFFAGTYGGPYEAALIDEFLASMPERPLWETARP